MSHQDGLRGCSAAPGLGVRGTRNPGSQEQQEEQTVLGFVGCLTRQALRAGHQVGDVQSQSMLFQLRNTCKYLGKMKHHLSCCALGLRGQLFFPPKVVGFFVSKTKQCSFASSCLALANSFLNH